MKKFAILLFAILCVTNLNAHEVYHDDDNNVEIHWDDARQTIKIDDEIKVYFKHKDLYITHEDEWDEVVITREGELFINDDEIKISKKAQKYMHEYYELADASHDKIRDIAKAGAKIGVHGATIGLKAVINVVRLISPTYDGDDLERDMEEEAEKIEKKGEDIEKEAEELEEIMEHIDDVHADLRGAVPELQDLHWF